MKLKREHVTGCFHVIGHKKNSHENTCYTVIILYDQHINFNKFFKD